MKNNLFGLNYYLQRFGGIDIFCAQFSAKTTTFVISDVKFMESHDSKGKYILITFLAVAPDHESQI